MSEATARANHVDYHIKSEDVTVKSHGKTKHVIKQTKTPVTIGELKLSQLKPWDGIQEGIRGQLTRNRAQRILMSQSPQPNS
jgi:hypothetical protein